MRGLIGLRIFNGSQRFLIAGYRTYVWAKNPKGEKKKPHVSDGQRWPLGPWGIASHWEVLLS